MNGLKCTVVKIEGHLKSRVQSFKKKQLSFFKPFFVRASILHCLVKPR